MAFSLYKQLENVNSLKVDATTDSPAFLNRYFTLTPQLASNKERDYGQVTLFGISTEAPVLKYNTTWEEGPTTNFIRKFNDMTDNNFVKTFAQKNANYQPIIATDSWTQKYPKGGAILEVPLKFRSYYDGSYNTINYVDCLKALFKYTAPRKFLFSQSISQIRYAMEAAKEIGFNVGDVIKEINRSIQNLNKNGQIGEISWSALASDLQGIATQSTSSTDTSGLKQIISNVEKKYSELKNKNEDMYNIATGFSALVSILNTITAAENPGCQTFSLDFGGVYKAGSYGEWVISSWSFVPSINTTYNSQPLYVDINLTVRTAGRIGTADIASIIHQ